MLLESEIAEEKQVKNIYVQTPYGWSKVQKVYKTIPLSVYRLETCPGKVIEGSAKHLVYTEDGWKELQHITSEDWVYTTDGWESVLNSHSTERVEELYDITIEDPDGAFFSDGILSHNSTTFCARQLVMTHVLNNYKSLYVVPHHKQLETYGARFLQMEMAFLINSKQQNVYNKTYPNRSTVNMIHCGETSQAARGKTSDEVTVDEAQSLNPDHVEDILYTLTDSKMPTKIFAGTALSIDTLLEAKWAESSMGMWHVRAGDGKHWLNMYDKDVLYKVCNNPQGPTCPYTGKLLSVTDGCFVHAYPGRQRDGRIGIHIPQCIIPDLAYDPIKWGAIYDKVAHTDFKKVLQECFGIAIAEGSREITSQDLQRLCVLTDTEEQLKKKCREGYYRQIISGCDWGGSDYNPNIKSKTSYTVHCIIGLAPDNCVDILHYRRYSGMMYPDIAASIIKDHEAFRGNIVASDFGVGLAYNMEIRKYLPLDKHFVIGYVGPKAIGVSEPKDAHLDNQLSVNRTEAITNVFRDAKCMAPQKIRCRNWTEMRQYLEDWLNMFRVPTEDNTGRSTFKYIRAATKADDALHAFTFAYVMMKIYLGESLVQDPQLAAKLRQILSGPSILSNNEELMNDMFGEPVYCISG